MNILRLFRAGAGATSVLNTEFSGVSAVPRGRGRDAIALWEDEFAKKSEVDNFANGCSARARARARELITFISSFFSTAVPRGRGRGAFALWLACHTQEEIAEATDVPRKTIDDWTGDFGEKLAADNSPFPADFEVPIYNVCNQQNGRAICENIRG